MIIYILMQYQKESKNEKKKAKRMHAKQTKTQDQYILVRDAFLI